MKVTKTSYTPSPEEISIARGDIVDHPAVSYLIEKGNPILLELILFNGRTHDNLRFKALRKVAHIENEDFDLKSKKSLVSKCLKETNFGNEFYFEGKRILSALKAYQSESVESTIRDHMQYVLDRQNALTDADFQAITADVDLLKNAFRFKVKLGKGIMSSALWNYVRMAQWAAYLEENKRINLELNQSLLEELEPTISLVEWKRIDREFGDIISVDTLVYSSFHKIAFENHHNSQMTAQAIENANQIIDKFDELVIQLEQLILQAKQTRTERELTQRKKIEERIVARKERESTRVREIKASSVRFVADASVNNRWP